jgi:hypothetical protein
LLLAAAAGLVTLASLAATLTRLLALPATIAAAATALAAATTLLRHNAFLRVETWGMPAATAVRPSHAITPDLRPDLKKWRRT